MSANDNKVTLVDQLRDMRVSMRMMSQWERVKVLDAAIATLDQRGGAPAEGLDGADATQGSAAVTMLRTAGWRWMDGRWIKPDHQFDDTEQDAVRQRDILAQAICDAAVKSGLYRNVPMTGPQLLQVCDDLAGWALAAHAATTPDAAPALPLALPGSSAAADRCCGVRSGPANRGE